MLLLNKITRTLFGAGYAVSKNNLDNRKGHSLSC